MAISFSTWLIVILTKIKPIKMNNKNLQVNWNYAKVRGELGIYTDDDMLLIEIMHDKHTGLFQINQSMKEEIQNLISEI